MALATESMEHAVDAHGLVGRHPLMAVQAILLAGMVEKIVMAGHAGNSGMVLMEETRAVDRRGSEACKPRLAYRR
jgi:hypothetical protein